MLVLGPFGRGSRLGQVQPLLLIVRELTGRSFKVIHKWLLPVLDLEQVGETMP